MKVKEGHRDYDYRQRAIDLLIFCLDIGTLKFLRVSLNLDGQIKFRWPKVFFLVSNKLMGEAGASWRNLRS